MNVDNYVCAICVQMCVYEILQCHQLSECARDTGHKDLMLGVKVNFVIHVGRPKPQGPTTTEAEVSQTLTRAAELLALQTISSLHESLPHSIHPPHPLG